MEAWLSIIVVSKQSDALQGEFVFRKLVHVGRVCLAGMGDGLVFFTAPFGPQPQGGMRREDENRILRGGLIEMKRGPKTVSAKKVHHRGRRSGKVSSISPVAAVKLLYGRVEIVNRNNQIEPGIARNNGFIEPLRRIFVIYGRGGENTLLKKWTKFEIYVLRGRAAAEK